MADRNALFIADASVLLKWALKEEESLEQALLFRNTFEEDHINIVVPAHCFTEIFNMLGREFRASGVSFASFLLESGIEQISLTLSTISIAFDLMKKHKGISFYDAAYHALAINEKGTFLTADEKYYKKTHKEGHIMLLSNYGKNL